MLGHIACKHRHEMHKLDEKKVRYIIREKRKGTKHATIAQRMGISTIWIKKLRARSSTWNQSNDTSKTNG